MLRTVFRSEMTALLSYPDIQRICLASAKSNKTVGITGFMIECGGLFVVGLEGPSKVVNETMRRIERDDRHHRIDTMLTCGDAHRRLFGAWSMNMMFLDDPLLWRRLVGSMEGYENMLDCSRDPVFSIGLLALSYRYSCSCLNIDPSADGKRGGRIPRLRQMLKG